MSRTLSKMVVDNTKLQYLSDNSIDKLVFSETVSLAAGATTTFGGVGQMVAPFAILTTDGGTTYQNAISWCYDSSNSYLIAVYNQTASTATVYVAGLLLPGATGAVTPNLTTSPTVLAMTSAAKYMPLLFSGSIDVAANTACTTTISHNLGYIPQVTVFSYMKLDATFQPNPFVAEVYDAVTSVSGLVGGTGYAIAGGFYHVNTTSLVFETSNTIKNAQTLYYYIRGR